MGKEGQRRFRLTLPIVLWNALVVEASRRELPVSAVVRERLALSLGVEMREGPGMEIPVLQQKQSRRQCRLWLESSLWDRLSEEAATQGMSMTAVIRVRLRQGEATTRHAPMRETRVLAAPDMPGPIGTKAISVFELSD